MSHAANLRNRPRPPVPESESPTKRRKVHHGSQSGKPNGITPLINGSTGFEKLIAVPSQNAKQKGYTKQDAPGSAHIRDADVLNSDVVGLEHKTRVDLQQDNIVNSDKDGQSDSEVEDEQENRPPEIVALQQADQNSSATFTAADNGALNEPSFGDLLRAKNLDPVIVETSSGGRAEVNAVAVNLSTRALSVPTATSLGTVLTQALKTNDVDLLESCLQNPSLDSIRATVQRLHPSYATVLLQRLAERLHKRPGRAGSLMVWVQWTIVAHGGYLANQQAAMKEIHTLYQVVKQRATGLQPLLALKGRLDMLEAQLQMRRNLQESSRGARDLDQSNDAVIYVEGNEDNTDDEGADPVKQDVSQQEQDRATRNHKSKALEIPDSDEEDGEMPIDLPNGDVMSEDDEELSDSEDEEAGLYDEEAEESNSESDELSDNVDYDDVDGIDEEDASLESEVEEETVRPLKQSLSTKRTRDGRR